MAEFRGDLVRIEEERQQPTVSFTFINEQGQRERRSVPLRQLLLLRVEAFLPICEYLLVQVKKAGVYDGMPQGEAREFLVIPVIDTLFYWTEKNLNLKMKSDFQEEVARLTEEEAEKESIELKRGKVRTGFGMQLENFALEALTVGDLSSTVARTYEDLAKDVFQHESHPFTKATEAAQWIAEKVKWRPEWLMSPGEHILGPFEERVKPMGKGGAEILNKAWLPIVGKFLEIMTDEAERRRPEQA